MATDIPGLDDWLEKVAAELDLPESSVDPGPLLRIASSVAHGVVRPGAPTSTYLVGLALGLQIAREDMSEDEIRERLRILSARVCEMADAEAAAKDAADEQDGTASA